MGNGFIPQDDYRRFDADSRKVGVRVFGWSLTTVLAVVFVIALIFIGTVAIAPWKGQGEAFRAKESGTNRVAAQERFEDLHQEILAADRKLDVFADAVAANPKSQVARTNLTGARAYCLDVVADYNAEARKYTSADFRAIDLPAQIDALSSDTDCKESSS